MSYPSPPWRLQGMALVNLHFVSVKNARCFIPAELEIVSVLPNLTLGGVYLSSYGAGSVLQYNELIVAPALVGYRNQLGFWISHIYVDNLDSVRGGREIWGLPKEMANFTWGVSQVSVSSSDRQLCDFSYQPGLINFTSWWRQKLAGNCISQLGKDFLLFTGEFTSKFTPMDGKLTIPPESPFSGLGLNQGFLTVCLTETEFIANIPQAIG